jgi:hypothetical protein
LNYLMDRHIVQPGDNLTKIGCAYGHLNPGPIWTFPENAAQFKGRDPNRIRPGETILVPYSEPLLRKMIATATQLGIEVQADAEKMMRAAHADKGDIDRFLFKIDAVNFLAGLGVGIGSLVAAGAKGTETTGKQALIWFAESRATVASNLATLSISQPDAPKRDFRFYVRHALGPWNPSYWASLYAAAQSGDVDVYLYGTDAVTHKANLKIKDQAERDLRRLKQRVVQAKMQLAAPFYRSRI